MGLSQVQGKAEELKDGAGKTASQAADAAEQAGGAARQMGASGSQPEAQADTQAANAEGAAAENSTKEPHGTAGGRKQETNQAGGTGAKAGTASSASLMERLRSMASLVQREVRSPYLRLTHALAASPFWGRKHSRCLVMRLLSGVDGHQNFSPEKSSSMA